MKKLLLTLGIAMAFYSSFAQDNTFPSPNGNVGIGTTTPGYNTGSGTTNSNILLDLYNSAHTSSTILRVTGTGEANGNYTGLLLGAGGLQGRGRGGVLYEPYGTAYGFGRLHFVVNQTAGEGEATLADTRMTIIGNGNVGIGTTSPGAKLEVAGNIRNSSLLVKGLQPGIDFANTSTGGHSWNMWSVGPSETMPNGSLAFYDETANQYRLGIDNNGNVGIGTSNPDAKLAVNGTIHSTEVKVDAVVPTPDYVFEPDYKLTSLEDIKAYVNKNHHLPEIPSAKEIEKDGIQLGDMNMKLLKKVEELTLYLIEQSKQLTDQQKINQSLQKQIDQLAKK